MLICNRKHILLTNFHFHISNNVCNKHYLSNFDRQFQAVKYTEYKLNANINFRFSFFWVKKLLNNNKSAFPKKVTHTKLRHAPTLYHVEDVLCRIPVDRLKIGEHKLLWCIDCLLYFIDSETTQTSHHKSC